jgi:hypothetical protein
MAEFDLDGEISVVLGKLDYQPHEGKRHEVFPTPSPFFIQEPYLVAPQAISSDFGLGMVVQFLSEPGSLTMDIRLETIAPLDRVSLGFDVSTNGMKLVPKSDRDPPNDGRYSRRQAEWWDVFKGEVMTGGIVTDLGEGGYAERQGDNWRMVMFDQPLEKGVILVGRLGFIRRHQKESQISFRQKHKKQLDRPTFL